MPCSLCNRFLQYQNGLVYLLALCIEEPKSHGQAIRDSTIHSTVNQIIRGIEGTTPEVTAHVAIAH
jgi:hypothetical protein